MEKLHYETGIYDHHQFELAPTNSILGGRDKANRNVHSIDSILAVESRSIQVGVFRQLELVVLHIDICAEFKFKRRELGET